MQWRIFSFEAREGGASIVMTDMRYMWSAIDSPWGMLNRRQPSLLVVFSRSRRWKNGTGDELFSSIGCGRVAMTGSAKRQFAVITLRLFNRHLPDLVVQGVLEPIFLPTDDRTGDNKWRGVSSCWGVGGEFRPFLYGNLQGCFLSFD